MKRRFYFGFALFATSAVVVIGTFSGCSRDQEAVAGTIERPEAEADAPDELGKHPAAEYLQRALKWSHGKTPEQMVQALMEEGSVTDDHFHAWRHYVTGLAFADAYGTAAGPARMQAAYQEAATHDRGSPHHEYRAYSGELGKYKEIYDTALVDPARALNQLDELVVHPDKLERLRTEVVTAYGMEHPREALGILEGSEQIKSYDAQKKIVRHWGRSDPGAALEYVGRTGQKRSMLELRRILLLDMVQYEPLTALEAAVNSPVNSTTDRTLEQVAERYVQLNPEDGFEWLMAQKNPDSVLIEAGVDALTKTHPEKAYAFMISVDPDLWQYNFLPDIAEQLAERDLESAMAWAVSVPGGDHRADALTSVFSVMGRKEPDRLIAHFDSFQSLGISPSMFTKIGKEFAQAHPEAAIRWVHSAPDSPAAAYVFGQAANSLVQQNPHQISAVLAMIDAGGYKSAVVGDVIKGWAEVNLDQATAWIRQNPERSDLENIVAPVAKRWFEQDPEKALQFAAGIPPGGARTSLLDAYVRSDSERNLDQVLGFILSLDPDEGSREQLENALRRGTGVQPERAMALVNSISDPKGRDQAIYGAAHTLVRIDPEVAADWVATIDFGEIEGEKRVIESVVDYWVRSDQDAAVEWTLNLPDTNMRHHASGRILSRVSPEDISTVSKLIQSAKPGDERLSWMKRAVRKLPDDYAVDAFISSVHLTQEEQAKLQKYREKK